ncbi:MAG: response regulator [Phycisphaerae bacterium]|nr:response regulator [Phycisphaerae bacterium]
MDGKTKIAHVLIVDDEPELRELLVDALSDSKIAVSVAGSGTEAIELARTSRPDILITDLCLGDCSGLDVIDKLRRSVGDVPAVVITGRGDTASLSEASRRRPLELMTKPLNLDRLRSTIKTELQRLEHDRREQQHGEASLRETISEMTREYRYLADETLCHQILMEYQNALIACKNDDDVFRSFFRMFVRKSGCVYGAALVCDSNAELRVAGRFGVPSPDNLEFCKHLAEPLVDILLSNPVVQLIETGDEPEYFDESIRRYLPGLSALAIPLIPLPGEMIGMVMLYRKGEQPFAPEDIELAQMMAHPTAVAIRRND